jgi:hypothetical protein
MSGWAREWTWSKLLLLFIYFFCCCQKSVCGRIADKRRKVVVETSPMRVIVGELGIEVIYREGFFWRGGVEEHFCGSWPMWR